MDSCVEADEALTRPPWGEFARVLTVTSVWAAGKFVLQVLNTTSVDGGARFEQALLERPARAPLVTVCNHTRCRPGRWSPRVAAVQGAARRHGHTAAACARPCSPATTSLYGGPPAGSDSAPHEVSRASMSAWLADAEAPACCSTVDDPFVFGALIPFSYISSEHRHKGVRWSLCAKEICFRNKLLGCVPAPSCGRSWLPAWLSRPHAALGPSLAHITQDTKAPLRLPLPPCLGHRRRRVLSGTMLGTPLCGGVSRCCCAGSSSRAARRSPWTGGRDLASRSCVWLRRVRRQGTGCTSSQRGAWGAHLLAACAGRASRATQAGCWLALDPCCARRALLWCWPQA